MAICIYAEAPFKYLQLRKYLKIYKNIKKYLKKNNRSGGNKTVSTSLGFNTLIPLFQIKQEPLVRRLRSPEL